MAKIKFGFYRLEVWKSGMRLVKDVYGATANFPKDEQFSLTAQLRRAVISVPLNIAEGSARCTKKDFAQFVRVALGSLIEVMTCLEIAKERNYINQSNFVALKSQIEILYFKLIGLDKSLLQHKDT